MFNSKNFNHLFNLINNLLFFICGCVGLSQVHSHQENISNIILSIHMILVSIILTYYEINTNRISHFYYGLVYVWNGILLFGLYKIGISIGIISIVNGFINWGMHIFYKDSEDSSLLENSSNSV